MDRVSMCRMDRGNRRVVKQTERIMQIAQAHHEIETNDKQATSNLFDV